MNYLGIEAEVRNLPELDRDFFPLYKFNHAFLASAAKPVGIAVERSGGEMASVHTFIHGTAEMREADRYYIRRLVKSMLWMKGGWRVYVSGDRDICDYIRGCFSADGCQAFDWDYFSKIYERPFEVVYTDALPEAKDSPRPAGGHFDGCRIGFDAGGSDRKVSAVIDGETVYSEEVVWFPKTNSDPDYHYDGIVAALKAAAAHMPRVDAVGVSSAGVYINNRTMNASLFLKVPQELFDAKVKDIYIRAITDTFGDVPFCVFNDGDVTALAGAISLEDTNILGATTGGINFTATPSFTDFGEDIDNCPKNMKELKKLDSWEVKLTGTFITTNTDLIALLMGAGDVGTTDTTKITPRVDVASADFKDLWLVCDYSDKNGENNGGYCAIKIINALSTGGFSMQSTDKGKAQFSFEFTGHVSMSAQTVVPFEVYLKEGTDEA